MPARRVLVCASIVCADLAHLADEVARLTEAGVDWLHFDCMDGHFVPPLTMGPPLVEAVRDLTDLHLDAHLMIEHPERQITDFARAGADSINVHREALADPTAVLDQIREAGCGAGLTYNPETPADDVERWLPQLHHVLIMSVRPGWSGQQFQPHTVEKVRQVRTLIQECGLPTHLQVDGGINAETAPLMIAAGADAVVSGTYLFGHPQGLAAAIRTLRGQG